MTTRRLRLVTILAAAVIGALGSASVAAHAPDPTLSGGAMAQDLELTFRWRSGAAPPSAHRTAILAAAADIAESRASRAALFRYDSDATNPIGYGNGATCSPVGIACFTRTLPRSFTMWFRPQGYAFDWGTLKWCQSYGTWPNGCFDVENIALDEFAHIEGLAHHVNYSDDDDYLDAVVQTYSRTKPREGYNAHVLARCDVATLQRLYDVQNSSQKYSKCLSLATSLALKSSATTVTYGSPTTLTATLLVADSSSYGLLRKNWVSNRTVTIQRRAVGTTTWATLRTMTPGSAATYTLSTAVTYDTEYRAVFSTPTDEGLRGDASPVVTVNVNGCSRPPCPLVAPE
jgi:hypothetical protein